MWCCWELTLVESGPFALLWIWEEGIEIRRSSLRRIVNVLFDKKTLMKHLLTTYGRVSDVFRASLTLKLRSSIKYGVGQPAVYSSTENQRQRHQRCVAPFSNSFVIWCSRIPSVVANDRQPVGVNEKLSATSSTFKLLVVTDRYCDWRIQSVTASFPLLLFSAVSHCQYKKNSLKLLLCCDLHV